MPNGLQIRIQRIILLRIQLISIDFYRFCSFSYFLSFLSSLNIKKTHSNWVFQALGVWTHDNSWSKPPWSIWQFPVWSRYYLTPQPDVCNFSYLFIIYFIIQTLATHYNWAFEALRVWKNDFSWSKPPWSTYQSLFWLENDRKPWQMPTSESKHKNLHF